MNELLNVLRLRLRALFKRRQATRAEPSVFVTAVLSLAIGIGANNSSDGASPQAD